jgi:hypothetical protein
MQATTLRKLIWLGLAGLLGCAGNVLAGLDVAAPLPPRAAKAEQPAPAEAVTPVSAAPEGDALKFRNGDLLHGTIQGIEGGTLLQWRRDDVKAPLGFALDNVLELQLAPRPPKTTRIPHRMVVELTNGDRLAGDLVSLNDKVLKLDTWYAGTLALKRSMVQRIASVAAAPDAIFAGPTGMSGWTTSENSHDNWKFKNGAFYSPQHNSCGVGRNVNLPDMANIEFDLAWRGQFYLQVGFYYEDLRNIYGSGGYAFGFNGSSVLLNRFANRGQSNLGNNVEVPKFQTKSKAHVSIRVNKTKKTIALFVDNELVKPWIDPEAFAGKGQGLLFYSQGQGLSRVSNIRVTTWDGRLDTGTAAAAAVAEDTVRLGNNDKISGTIKSIAKGEVVMATSFMEMKVPLERVAQIDFAEPQTEKPHRQAGDVRAVFLDGSRFTLAMEKLTDQALIGSAESCGRVSTALDAFSRIQFRIYEARPASGAGDEWGEGDGENKDGREL